MQTFNVIYRIARFNRRDVPCVFIPSYPANYGEITIYNDEGCNAADMGYYRKTRPAKTAAEIAQCEQLAHRFDTLGPVDEHTSHRVMRRIDYAELRGAWQR